jgi:hypothetical protein
MVGSRAPETARHSAKQTDVQGSIRHRDRLARVGDILRAAGEALHCNEILAPDDSQRAPMEWNIDSASESVRVEPAKTGKEVHAITMAVADREQRGNRVIRTSLTQFGVEARNLQGLLELPDFRQAD